MRRLLLATAACVALVGCAAPPVTATTADWVDDGGGLAHRQITPWVVCYRYGAALSCVHLS